MENENSRALIEKGYELLEHWNFVEGKKYFKKALEIDSTSAEAYLGLFMAYNNFGDKDMAKKKYVEGYYADNKYWKRTMQYASGSLKAELDSWEYARGICDEAGMKDIQTKLKDIQQKWNERTIESRSLIAQAENEIKAINKEIETKKSEMNNLGLFGRFKKGKLQAEIAVLEDRLKKKESELFHYQIVYSDKNDMLERYHLKIGIYGKVKNRWNKMVPRELEWSVVGFEGNRALLISSESVDFKPYAKKSSTATWENSEMRRWLNEEFLNIAFNPIEKNYIAAANVPADRNPEFDSDPGNATLDKIFLLSIPEAKKYFLIPDSGYCRRKDFSIDGDWWLRTPGRDNEYAAVVWRDGKINSYGSELLAGNMRRLVRPAMWIDLTPVAPISNK